ncbi:response regulator [candidate division KSB1 bacterium]|nr:response regulator [candidate division KSB1 bacterium]
MTSKAQVLVVEDDSIISEDIQRSLKKLGYPVVGVFSSGEEALAKIESLHPDVVLMDIVLQGRLNGIDAANRIRSKFHLPVVFLTAYSDQITMARAKDAKPSGYITKPFTSDELDDVLKHVMKHPATEK